jgi:hypothetical protein
LKYSFQHTTDAIAVAAWEVEQGQSYLKAKPNLPELSEMAAEAKKHYVAQMDRYQKSLPGPATESQALALIVPATPSEEKTENGGSDVDVAPKQVIKVQACEPVEAPLPPNVLTPYPANIFGLDKARRDCRFEMIKIVKEVRNSLCALSA